MQRDLLDALRCPAHHEESWLVAMVHTADGADLVEAEVSCPVCGAEYPIVERVAYFGVTPRADAPPDRAAPLAADGLRLAALLGVTSGGVPVALVGLRAILGPALAALVPVPQLHVNPPAVERVVSATDETAPVSVLRIADRLPLGVGTVAAIALDAAHATPAFVDSAVRALRAGARMIAPVGTPLPASMKELARDDQDWVAEALTQASGLVELRRRDPDAVR